MARNAKTLSKVKREAKAFRGELAAAHLSRARLEVAVLEAKNDGWHLREIAEASETFSHVTARSYATSAATPQVSEPKKSPINILRRMQYGSGKP